MELMTIRDFAEDQHVSYEAIRRQLAVYRTELKDHIIKKGRTQYLDEYAIEFLKGKRRENPVIVVKEDFREENEQLKQDYELLKNQIMKLQERMIELEREKNGLLEHKIKNELLLEMHNKDQEQIQDIRTSLQTTESILKDTKDKLQEVEQEVNSFKKSWFGFYRKK